ncbi:class I SAM-dependent methyltransferase [Methanofollis sp. UBA420]|jgi:ubiquinone/menaquinone biosynthesis C-methylase UbiE|uniref:class I SAM-dependent methyltransferase n=1 Tax=Methanofollis sp. UBA420 TaxID=1915514 RepID=UPI00316AC599
MVNIKEYDVEVDFRHHLDEFTRCYEIIERNFQLKDSFVLDLCAGTGMHTGFLVGKGCRFTIGVDLLDYETLWGGKFKQNLLDLYARFNYPFDGAKCQFIKMNAESLLFKDQLFDSVFCLNAFEHVSDPEAVLKEIWHVLKPNGFAYIQFDPLYYCDTGSHMFDFIALPWEHLLRSQEQYESMLQEADCPPAVLSDFKYGLNRRNKEYFFTLFDKYTDPNHGLFEKIVSYTWSGVVNKSHLEHPNYLRAQKYYPKEDLLFRGMNILLKKCRN